ncbi:MAG: amidohydrolase family protein [Myxococcales bacterium]|nr:amidohydrolase family protein [Myxococcales bacterium]
MNRPGHHCQPTRRRFLAASGGLTGALALSPWLDGCASSRDNAGAGPEPDATPPAGAGSDIDQAPAEPPVEPLGSLDGSAPTAGSGASEDASPSDRPPPDEPGVGDVLVDEPLCSPEGAGGELIIDASTVFLVPQINPLGIVAPPDGWLDPENYPLASYTEECEAQGRSWTLCVELDDYVDLIYGSDTSIAVLGGFSYSLGEDGTGVGGFAYIYEEQLLEGVEQIESSHPGRVLHAAPVMPADRPDLQLARMDRLAPVAHAWSTETAWSPAGTGGFRLDDAFGQGMIRRGLELERPIFYVRKSPIVSGLPPGLTSPADVGPAARMFPEARIVVQGAAFESGLEAGFSSAPDPDPEVEMGWGPGVGLFPEGPYDELDEEVQQLYPLDRGVNSLIKALRDHNIGPGGRDLDDPEGPITTHVYAECSKAWPALADPRREREAMHFWGKLLKHVGEDRILWGTGAILYGGPQTYIDLFRQLEISDELRDRYGYPQLTAARKEKILGQNAARLFSVLPNVSIDGCHGDQLQARLLTRRALLPWA